MARDRVLTLSADSLIIEGTVSLVLSCDCKSVTISLSGAPAARAYCHCATCREFHDVTLLAATAWSPHTLAIVAGAEHLREYRHPTKQMRRRFCTRCGEILFGVNRLGMAVIRNAVLAKAQGGQLASELTPQFHLFYGARVVDVNDDLPKYIEGRDGPLFSSNVISR